MLVQSACESRANLHEIAWILLGALLIGATTALTIVWIWIVKGGFSNYFYLHCPAGRRQVEDWLHEQ
jgi:hypothetical protein